MELLQLKYFLEVARSEHITKSAERLHIAQPSLSQSIKRLEAELGVPLFASRGRNIELTEYGKFLKEKLEPIMKRLDALPEQIKEMADPERITIRLHVTAASLVVSDAVIKYRQLHDKVHFQFLLNEDDALCDMSIETRPDAPTDTAENVFTCREKIYVAAPGPVPKEGSEHSLREFADSDFISLIALKQFRQICDKLCAQAGFMPHVAFESDSPETVRNMIAANMGVGFWPAFTWGELSRDNAHLVDIAEPECYRYILIRKHKNRMDNQVVDDFFTFLSDFFAMKS